MLLLSKMCVCSQGISHLLNAAHPGPQNCMTVDCSHIQQRYRYSFQIIIFLIAITTIIKSLQLSEIVYLGLQLSDDSTEDIRAVFSQAGRS